MNFPKFMIRQPGGLAVGAISTRSRLASFAFWSASAIGTIPRASPASPIRRTSFQRICSLTRMLFLSILLLHGQLTTLLTDRLPGERKNLVHRERPRVAPVPQAHRNGAGRGLLLSQHEHRGDLLHFRLADAGAELLVPVIELGEQAGGGEAAGDRARPPREKGGDGQHGRVDRGDPEGEVARRVFDQDPEEPLDGPEDRAVEHDRTVLLAVLADVRQVEALAVLEVALDRAELPGAAEGVLHAEGDLRAVEGAVAGRHDVRPIDFLQRRRQSGLPAVPELVRADALGGA